MAKRKATERKRGRPPLRPKRRKRNNVTIRFRDDLKSKVQKAGEDNGRSLSEEIEARVERSFSDPDARLQSFGSDERLKLLSALSLAVDMVEATMGKDIFTDAETAEVGYKAMTGLLDGIFSARPSGPLDTVTPTEGQKMIIKEPSARSLDQNIRDAILEGLLPQIPAVKAAFAKKRRR